MLIGDGPQPGTREIPLTQVHSLLLAALELSFRKLGCPPS